MPRSITKEQWLTEHIKSNPDLLQMFLEQYEAISVEEYLIEHAHEADIVERIARDLGITLPKQYRVR